MTLGLYLLPQQWAWMSTFSITHSAGTRWITAFSFYSVCHVKVKKAGFNFGSQPLSSISHFSRKIFFKLQVYIYSSHVCTSLHKLKNFFTLIWAHTFLEHALFFFPLNGRWMCCIGKQEGLSLAVQNLSTHTLVCSLQPLFTISLSYPNRENYGDRDWVQRATAGKHIFTVSCFLFKRVMGDFPIPTCPVKILTPPSLKKCSLLKVARHIMF